MTTYFLKCLFPVHTRMKMCNFEQFIVVLCNSKSILIKIYIFSFDIRFLSNIDQVFELLEPNAITLPSQILVVKADC